MIKNIPLSGYTAVPDDYSCSDGQLAVSLNIINEDGALRKLGRPSVLFKLPDGFDCMYIHKCSGATVNYIIYNKTTRQICHISESDSQPSAPIITMKSDTELYNVSAIGDTLLILTSRGIMYISWRDGSYCPLGYSIPQLPLKFKLCSALRRVDFSLDYGRRLSEGERYPEEIDDVITEQVMAQVNKAVAENGSNDGRFIFPFFVRYALRLYDGSLTLQSPPVLMTPVFGEHPIVTCENSPYEASKTNAYIGIIASRLCYSYIGNAASHKANLQKWSDIVKSVDIFVSAPIFSYDQSGKCTSLYSPSDNPLSSQFSLVDIESFHGSSGGDASAIINRGSFKFSLERTWQSTGIPSDTFSRRIKLPKFDSDAGDDKYSTTANFYLLKSIPIDELGQSATNENIIDVPDDYLQSLTERERLPDDYDSHDRLVPQTVFNYNGRLCLAGITKHICPEFNPLTAIMNIEDSDDLSGSVSSRHIDITVYVFLKIDGKEYVVRSKTQSSDSRYGDGLQVPFFYYPNQNAYKAMIVVDNTHQLKAYEYVSFDLKRHDYLNGAYYFGGINPSDALKFSAVEGDTVPAETDDCVICRISNKIYNSEVNNPFVFPLTGITTLGAGEIMGISTAAKALSQGQFGQFPLYAFTTEGVWALEISATGTFSARQPITRDVCTNAKAITQTDSAVLFPTDRGIMLISGSETHCITDTINTREPFVITTLPHIDDICALFDISDIKKNLPADILSDYLKNCSMIYDYTHQQIIIFNDSYKYAYVYSLKSEQWGVMQSAISNRLNSYPEALAVDDTGRVLNFSVHDGVMDDGLIVTRPLKVEDTSAFKTITRLFVKGDFSDCTVKTVLYGSRDLSSWHLIASSVNHRLNAFSGSPYKYFIVALVAALSPGESISHLTFDCHYKYPDKLC